MVNRNLTEVLGADLRSVVSSLAARAHAAAPDSVVSDGRLLPHEWLATPRGFCKVDAFEHGDDHFFPGACDIAWDLAGARVELSLDPGEQRSLLSRYIAATHDRSVSRRLPFFEIAYLAFRLGYARMARQVLAGSAEAAAFARLENRYDRAVRARIADLSS
jgi:hypothetical protein